MKMTSTMRQLTRSPAQRALACADSLRDLRDWPAAAEAYAKVVELDPSLAPIWIQYGHALKESGDMESAEAAYRRSIALVPHVADSHLQLGHCLKLAGRAVDAGGTYLTALELDHHLTEALREVQDLSARGVSIDGERFEAVIAKNGGGYAVSVSDTASPQALSTLLDRLDGESASEELRHAIATIRSQLNDDAKAVTGRAPSIPIIFDASDLMSFFRHSRVPTGIQRVQLEIMNNVLRSETGGSVQLCALHHGRWVPIPTSLFTLLANLAVRGGDTRNDAWRGATTRLEIALGSSVPFIFPQGACLINLGTSWHVDYLLQIRNIKRQHGIRYVPFVHDLIPIVASQFVVSGLTEDYIIWLLAVFDHADLFLANSQCTRRDLLAAAKRLGYARSDADVVVVPLDARFTPPQDKTGAGTTFMRRSGLLGTDFVLMVGTVEPRKNHAGAIAAWAELIDSLGERMPKLVCVGGRGWMNDSIFARVADNALLSRHVVFLHDLSDEELAACYSACLFTLFPSFYEGWGLPVTESLSHGKVAVISDAASLPEAGGEFAVYFESGSHQSLVTALKRIIAEPEVRVALEARIAASFRPRAWHELGEQIEQAIAERFGETPTKGHRSGMAIIRPGAYYSFGRSIAKRLRPGLVSGEALRSGDAWHMPETWGSWSRGGQVEIAGQIERSAPLRLFIGVQGLPSRACYVTIWMDGEIALETRLDPSQIKWLPIDGAISEEDMLTVTLSSDVTQDLALLTDGGDGRIVGLGLIGFYACRSDDIAARMSFIEGLSTGYLQPGLLVTPPPMETIPSPMADLAAPESDDDAPGTRTVLNEVAMVPNTTRREILLLQSSDPVVYKPMLDRSAVTTHAFCERHGHRHEIFIGLKRGILPWHAIYNRIILMMDLIKADYQGWVFYMDADSWINDLDFDLGAYLSDKSDYALIGAPAEDHFDHHWNINDGIMLVNLGHSFARAIVTEWTRFLDSHDLARDAKAWNREIPCDQGMLHQILDKLPRASETILIEDKAFFNSPWATFVRQALRAENNNFEGRLRLISEEVDMVMHGRKDGVVAADEKPGSLQDSTVKVPTKRKRSGGARG